MLSILTWNINSIRKRLDGLARLIELTGADVVCLQETKVHGDLFPCDAVGKMGLPYHAVAGQPGYNGVSIHARWPLRNIARHHHCGREDARHISAVLSAADGVPIDDAVSVHSLYVPAGGDIPNAETNPKFAHKLKFMDAVADHFAAGYGFREPMVVAGDLNVAPLPSDVWDHVRLSKVVTHTPIEIAALERMKRSLAFIDVVREVIPADDPAFTWWSYRAADWQAVNKGRRLDHIWVTAPLKERIASAEVLVDVRHWQPPSDHVPVLMKLRASVEAPADQVPVRPSGGSLAEIDAPRRFPGAHDFLETGG